jgi:hypothetical protein
MDLCVKDFFAAKLARATVDKASIVEYRKSIACGISFCLGAIAEDNVAWGFILEPALEVCNGSFFGCSFSYVFSFDVIVETACYKPRSFDLFCAYSCSQESAMPLQGSATYCWLVASVDFMLCVS